MKLKKFVVFVLVAVMALTSLSGCAGKKDLKHEIIMYFPNWKLQEENGNVSDIPWDKVTYINHAFWEVYPTSEADQTTFERRELGLEPRTEFTVVSTLPNQDWAGASQYLDYINIMTYDMAGDWDGVTGHASSAAGAKTAMAYFINNDIPGSKLNLGSPFYATGFMMAEDTDFSKIVGAPIAEENYIDKEMLTVPFIKKVVSEAVEVETPGWHAGYDEKQMGAYVYNDDPNSEYYRWYLSYEDTRAIDGKYALIEKYNLAGIIVWEVTQDSTDHELTNYLFEKSK